MKLALFIALVAATSLAACGGKPSESECEKLVRHVIELEAAEAGGGAAPPAQRPELEQRKKSVFQTVGTSYCRDEMSVEQVTCGLEAVNLAELSTKCEQS